MKSRAFALTGTLIAIAVALLAPVPTAGQEPTSSKSAWKAGASSKPFTPKRLHDSQPDIQGIYINQWVVPIERFTREERADFEKAIVAHRGPNHVAGPGTNGAYGNEWFDRPSGGTGRPDNSPHPPGDRKSVV